MTNTETQSITHIWDRFNPRWILSGLISGNIAGLLILALAGFITQKTLGEFTQAPKLIGAAIYGGDGLAFGPLGAAGIAGLIIHLALSSLYGVTYAQMVNEKSSRGALIILGMVTGFIIWIFGCRLFMPAFNLTLRNHLPAIPGVLLHLLFGALFGLIISIVRIPLKASK